MLTKPLTFLVTFELIRASTGSDEIPPPHYTYMKPCLAHMHLILIMIAMFYCNPLKILEVVSPLQTMEQTNKPYGCS